MRPGAVTHAFDMEQRLVEIEIAAVLGGKLRLVGPPNANIAPPGYYMLFLIDSAGVPSVATFVQLGSTADVRIDPPPPRYAASASNIPLSASATRRIGTELLRPCGDCICAGWDHRRWS